MRILARLPAAWLCLLPAAAALAAASEYEPRGPSQWTARNWVGFVLYIAVFLLVVIGLYKLSGVGEEEGPPPSPSGPPPGGETAPQTKNP